MHLQSWRQYLDGELSQRFEKASLAAVEAVKADGQQRGAGSRVGRMTSSGLYGGGGGMGSSSDSSYRVGYLQRLRQTDQIQVSESLYTVVYYSVKQEPLNCCK